MQWKIIILNLELQKHFPKPKKEFIVKQYDEEDYFIKSKTLLRITNI